MNLYARYIKERENTEYLENSDNSAFCTYSFQEVDGYKICYIKDIYVLPERRKDGLAAELADEVAKKAKELGYEILQGSVDKRTTGWESSAKVLKAYGMVYVATANNLDYYAKEIK